MYQKSAPDWLPAIYFLASLVWYSAIHVACRILDVVIAGTSQAVVEGVAEVPPLDLTPDLLFVSPIAVYLLVFLAHYWVRSQDVWKKSIELAVTDTFHFHLIWYVAGVFVFLVDGGPVDCRHVGVLYFVAGRYFAFVLLLVFCWQLVRRLPDNVWPQQEK